MAVTRSQRSRPTHWLRPSPVVFSITISRSRGLKAMPTTIPSGSMRSGANATYSGAWRDQRHVVRRGQRATPPGLAPALPARPGDTAMSSSEWLMPSVGMGIAPEKTRSMTGRRPTDSRPRYSCPKSICGSRSGRICGPPAARKSTNSCATCRLVTIRSSPISQPAPANGAGEIADVNPPQRCLEYPR
ncbi:MAG: hypothetical protein JWR51_3445 [Devosia sp.]|nr:hypothetical protein [Devosia sp.]